MNTAEALIYTHVPYILITLWIVYESISIRKTLKKIKKKVG